MPLLSIRNLDEKIIDKLKTRAEEAGRSLEAELWLILQLAVSGDE